MTKQLKLPYNAISKKITIGFICVLLCTSAHASRNLDDLFFLLKHTTDSSQATKIENKIWETWMQSGDADIDSMMKEVMKKRSENDYSGAIVILNRMITMKPNYSEAWNQRATMYYFQGKFEESLLDISKTLELEPRHFGSLTGRAAIRIKQKKPYLAQQNIIDALEIHPFINERYMFPGLIRS